MKALNPLAPVSLLIIRAFPLQTIPLCVRSCARRAFSIRLLKTPCWSLHSTERGLRGWTPSSKVQLLLPSAPMTIPLLPAFLRNLPIRTRPSLSKAVSWMERLSVLKKSMRLPSFPPEKFFLPRLPVYSRRLWLRSPAWLKRWPKRKPRAQTPPLPRKLPPLRKKPLLPLKQSPQLNNLYT